MIPAGPVLAFLLALQPAQQDRAEASYVDRQALIAYAVASESDSLADAAALLTLAEFESHRARAVHSGAVRGGAGEGLWQLEPGSRRSRPFAGLSWEETSHAAHEALWLWHRSGQCGRSVASHFAAYAGSCAFAQAARRERFYYWTLHELSKFSPSQAASPRP